MSGADSVTPDRYGWERVHAAPGRRRVVYRRKRMSDRYRVTVTRRRDRRPTYEWAVYRVTPGALDVRVERGTTTSLVTAMGRAEGRALAHIDAEEATP